MTPLLLIFGLFSGCFLAVLVGLIGSRRSIGFGWAFIISLIFTPIVGLICALLTNPLPSYNDQKMGCVGVALSIIGALLLIPLTMFLIAFFSLMFMV